MLLGKLSEDTGLQTTKTLSLIPSEFQLYLGRGWLTSETALVKRINRNDANGYYKALGLLPSATRLEIKAAFRKLVMKLHPDRGGDEELFRYVVEIAKVRLDPEEKSRYDAVGIDAIYVGSMEREELVRSGVMEGIFNSGPDGQISRFADPGHLPLCEQHWACLTDSGFPADDLTDAWSELCREVSPAVGYRGRLRVGVIEGGLNWPCDPSRTWGIFTTGLHTFVIFQRGIEPNRLIALCAMIDWQSYLLKQIHQGRATAQDREKTSWL
jgi:hypothetical protein